jgi:hypothetical protein
MRGYGERDGYDGQDGGQTVRTGKLRLSRFVHSLNWLRQPGDFSNAAHNIQHSDFSLSMHMASFSQSSDCILAYMFITTTLILN